MNRKELEAQMTSILIPVAAPDWLIERCCNLAELYAHNNTKKNVSGAIEFLAERLIVIQNKKDKAKRKIEYMSWHFKEQKLIDVIMFINELSIPHIINDKKNEKNNI